MVLVDHLDHQVHLDHLDHPDQMDHQVLQGLKVHLALGEDKETLDPQAPLGQLDQPVVMESQGLMAGMETKENKELLVHKDQE